MKPEKLFAPHWPEGLRPDQPYSVACDDERGSGLRVIISKDGDAWVQCHEGAGKELEDYRDAGIRVRTHIGGGHNMRTHQALLYLALAMQLDAADNPVVLSGEGT